MNKSSIWFFGSLAIVFFVAVLLTTGSPLLTMPLYKAYSIPIGTPISWFGMIALPLTVYFGVYKMRSPKEQLYIYLSRILKVSLILAILWVPVCYWLAGNLSFTFTEKDVFQGGQTAMRWFWRFSISVVLIPILTLIIHWFSLFFMKIIRKN